MILPENSIFSVFAASPVYSVQSQQTTWGADPKKKQALHIGLEAKIPDLLGCVTARCVC